MNDEFKMILLHFPWFYESLLLIKDVFIQSKIQKKKLYCEILLQFLILVSYLNIL